MKKNASRSKADSGNSFNQASGKTGGGNFFSRTRQGRNNFFKAAVIRRKPVSAKPGKDPVQPNIQNKLPDASNGQLVQKAMQTTGNTVDQALKQPLSKYIGENLDYVRIHDNPDSGHAAESIHAKAFTIGNQVHLGPAGKALSGKAKEELLTHEIVHTLQQKNVNPHVQAKMPVSQPQDGSEQHANSIASEFVQMRSGNYHSPGLAMRNKQRIEPVNEPLIHRDIKGYYTLPYGKMEVDFTKNDATVAGASASETGEVKFHPNANAPESDEIRLVQIVRTIDVSGATGAAGSAVDWSNVDTGAEADRNKLSTTANSAKNIAGDFYVDHSAATANPRTSATDAALLPYYNAYWGGGTGKRKGKTNVAATLRDGPNSPVPVEFSFVTSAKGNDNGVWYGTALWGFEVYHTKTGISKIKNEYKKFRQFQGETTDAALVAFNDFYKNPGTAGAP